MDDFLLLELFVIERNFFSKIVDSESFGPSVPVVILFKESPLYVVHADSGSKSLPIIVNLNLMELVHKYSLFNSKQYSGPSFQRMVIFDLFFHE